MDLPGAFEREIVMTPGILCNTDPTAHELILVVTELRPLSILCSPWCHKCQRHDDPCYISTRSLAAACEMWSHIRWAFDLREDYDAPTLLLAVTVYRTVVNLGLVGGVCGQDYHDQATLIDVAC